MPTTIQRRCLSADDRLVFVHIPKTAGTTFVDVLRQRYRDDEIFPPYMHAELLPVRQQDLGAYRFYRGHFNYGILKRLLPPNAVYVTFLRDPIERAISHYAFLQNHPALRGRLRVWETGIDMETFAFHPIAFVMLANFHTRMLGREFTCNTIEEALAAAATEERHALLGKYPPAAAAMRALDEMAYFGLTERFADSLRLLGHTFGWQPLADVGALNVAPRRPLRQRLPQPLLDRLIELNQEDLQLYAYAKQLFEDRYRAAMADAATGAPAATGEAVHQ